MCEEKTTNTDNGWTKKKYTIRIEREKGKKARTQRSWCNAKNNEHRMGMQWQMHSGFSRMFTKNKNTTEMCNNSEQFTGRKDHCIRKTASSSLHSVVCELKFEVHFFRIPISLTPFLFLSTCVLYNVYSVIKTNRIFQIARSLYVCLCDVLLFSFYPWLVPLFFFLLLFFFFWFLPGDVVVLMSSTCNAMQKARNATISLWWHHHQLIQQHELFVRIFIVIRMHSGRLFIIRNATIHIMAN